MKTILHSAEFTHIPKYSVYNCNFYRNTINGKILLQECDDDNDSENNSDINMIPVYIGERTMYINNDDLPVW